MNALQLLAQGDAVTRAVALLLLAMSVASWVVILHKGWALRAAGRSLAGARGAFWAAPSLAEAQAALQQHDGQALLRPLVDAAQTALAPPAGALAAAGDVAQRLTRALRDALRGQHERLHFGQVLLASVGATAPFVGLLGTVWGIFHALTGIADAGQISIDKVSGPVGEALIMTAAGLAVAVENGTEDARAAADRVIPSPDEDGIAVFVEELLG